LSLPHADNVSAITTAIAANTPERLAFIPLSFIWVTFKEKPRFTLGGGQLEMVNNEKQNGK
jgi:hypothetical protein